jgi:hypothetical protein
MSSLLPRPINRLLLLAPPGEGKTSLLREIVRQYRIGGTILDPLSRGDYKDVSGQRWDVRSDWPFSPDHDAPPPEDSAEYPDWLEDYNAYAKLLEDVRRGEMLVVDEAARFLPSQSSPRTLLFQWADTARNREAKFVFAEKRPARLSALAQDVASDFAFRPTRSASAWTWLAGAGVDRKLCPPLPNLAPSLDNEWYLLLTGGELVKTTAREILHGILVEGPFSS